MDVSDDELRTYSYAELLEYTFHLRCEIKKDGYVYPYKTSWFNLPLEMRDHVIHMMDLKTRCIFSECSTICEKDVTKSKVKVFAIYLEYRDNRFEIDVGQRCIDCDEVFSSFHFRKFKENETMIEYQKDKCDSEVSTTIVKGDPIQIATKFANYMFKKYKNSIDVCYAVDGYEFSIFHGIKFGILENLEEVRFFTDPEKLDHFNQIGVIELERFYTIDYLTMRVSLKYAFEFSLKFKGQIARLECVDFDMTLIDNFLIRLKNTGINEDSIFTIKFREVQPDLNINTEKLNPINCWEKENTRREMWKYFVFETNTADPQKIEVSYCDDCIYFGLE